MADALPIGRENALAIARGAAAHAGLTLNEAALAAVVADLEATVRQAGHVFTVVDSTGHEAVTVNAAGAVVPLDVVAHVRAVAAKHSAARPAASTPPAPTITEQMASEAATRRQAEADRLARLGNPWRRGHENLTNQMALERLDPALAAGLRARAGVS